MRPTVKLKELSGLRRAAGKKTHKLQGLTTKITFNFTS